MVEYSKINFELSDPKLHKLKSAAKKQIGVDLRISIKMFNGKGLPHELLLTTR